MRVADRSGQGKTWALASAALMALYLVVGSCGGENNAPSASPAASAEEEAVINAAKNYYQYAESGNYSTTYDLRGPSLLHAG
jgi:hypothetical protein